MMIDFALEAERNEGKIRPRRDLSGLPAALPADHDDHHGGAARRAAAGARHRHRIGMRRPLGIAIVGGLIVSQMLTLYTTPVVYLYLDRVRVGWVVAWRRIVGTWGSAPANAARRHRRLRRAAGPAVEMRGAILAPLIRIKARSADSQDRAAPKSAGSALRPSPISVRASRPHRAARPSLIVANRSRCSAAIGNDPPKSPAAKCRARQFSAPRPSGFPPHSRSGSPSGGTCRRSSGPHVNSALKPDRASGPSSSRGSMRPRNVLQLPHLPRPLPTSVRLAPGIARRPPPPPTARRGRRRLLEPVLEARIGARLILRDHEYLPPIQKGLRC